MTDIVSLPVTGWDEPCPAAVQQQAIAALEAGSVLLLPRLRFEVREDEAHLLSPAAAGRAKNVSLDPDGRTLKGTDAAGEEVDLIRRMMQRFSAGSKALLRNLLPRYDAHLQQARTSYRPLEIAGRTTSWRKDDTRLHVDSFPSSPTQGRRILRVFSNIHPQGRERTWRLGEPFETVAQRYVPVLPAPVPGASFVLHALRITRSRRTDYDQYMLHLHDRMKSDAAYQARAVQRRHEFPPGCTWIVFTDQTSHAAMSGQYALEQTFLLPVHAMQDPARSPLRVLERIVGCALV